MVRFRVEVPGLRTGQVVLVTTLLDRKKYPDSDLIALYRRRWQVELCFRDIKTALGLDVLRTLTPAMIEKEILLQAIAYNLVRALMAEAACAHDVSIQRLSFTGILAALRQWASSPGHTCTHKKMLADLRLVIASDQLPFRPNRSEPRARKRRPKPYQWLTKPRHEMKVSSSRNQK